MRMSISTLLVLSIAMCVYAHTHGEVVEYTVDDVVFKGYLAYKDQVEGKRPGVLVVHEWWGHNEYVRNRARMLAELGYTALAIDMYGDGKLAKHPDDAGKFARAVMENMEVAKARFTAGMDLLKKHPTVNSEHIAAIGYCFGGGIVLHMARLGIDELDGVVSFHGSLSTQTPAERGTVKAKILVCHGAVDPFITPKQVDAFKKEMQNAEVDFKFVVYPEASHGFTNPAADKHGGSLRYNAAADKQSWTDMQRFFKTLFTVQ